MLKIKNYIQFINEKSTQLLDNDTNNIINSLISGKDAFAYHGTNRTFDKFDNKHIRDWRAETFLGSGVFLTANFNIAIKYSDANANGELPMYIIDNAKKIDPDLYWFMHSLYHNGNSTWNEEKTSEIRNKFNIDLNDICEIVNHIPNSQSKKDYDKDTIEANHFYNIFGNSSQALPSWLIDDIKKLDLGNFEPRVLKVKIKPTKNILISKNKNVIKKDTKHDIIIAYDVDSLIDDYPEIIVKNTDLLEIVETIDLEYN